MNVPNAIPTFGATTAPHLYRIGVEPTPAKVYDDHGVFLREETVRHIEVHARTRWAAMAIAEKAHYVVRDCNMIG